MITVSEAEKLITDNCNQKEIAERSLCSASGFVLAADAHALYDVPSFHNSAMDGYAFCFNGENLFEIKGTIQAGSAAGFTVEPRQAVRIFTGAPIPTGTDTVAKQEITEIANNQLKINSDKIRKGDNIRLRGSQCKAGDVIAKQGAWLTPGLIALLASAGIEKVKVFNIPSVAVIVTGNELQPPGTPLHENHIYNSNQPAICAFLKMLGVEQMSFSHIADSLQLLSEAIRKALQSYDMIIVSGGISAGDYDFVRPALLNNGVQQLFYKVKQKPGKPLFAGYYLTADNTKKPVFALPGNPAAAISCMLRYVKPCILQRKGLQNAWSDFKMLPLANSFSKISGLTLFAKVKPAGNKVWITGGQESFNLLPFSDCCGMAELPENAETFSEGTLVKTYFW